MGRAGMIWGLLLGICGLLLGGTAGAAEPVILRICHEHADVHPWSTSAGKGLNYELLNRAAAASGVQLQFDIVSWKRCLLMLKANEVDGAFAGSFKEDRLVSGAYPMKDDKPDAGKRLHMDRYVLVRRAGSKLRWDGTRLSHLAGPVGIQMGYSIADQLKALKIEVDEGAQSAEDLLRKLSTGRVDAAALLAGEASAVLSRNQALARALEVLPQPLSEKPYFLLLSHGLMARDGALARRLWDSIEKVRESAAYQARERAVLTGGLE